MKTLLLSILLIAGSLCAQERHDGVPVVDAETFTWKVATEQVPGVATFEKYGKNPDVTTAEDIWNGGGTYLGFPTNAAETLEIYSSSSSDTNSGTGAWTVRIYNLLDAVGNSSTNVDVTLAGTLPVVISTNLYYRGGSRIRVLTGGSGGGNAGTLHLRHTTTTNDVFAVMPVGLNSTAISAYTVPVGKTLYINRIHMSMARANAATADATMSFRAREHGGVFQGIVNPQITTSQAYNYNNGYFVFPARTDLKIRCDEVSATSIITTEFGGELRDNKD